MFQNYLKIAFRNLGREKFYALINILGLAISIACCLLILVYVQDELSYDRFPENSERIYRVSGEINFGGNHSFYAVTPAPMAAALANDYPEVESSFRFRNSGDWLVRSEQTINNAKETQVAYADSNFFNFFTIPVLLGEARQALVAPEAVAISASAAERHFGRENPLGKTLVFDNDRRYNVSAVFEDVPENAHFHFDFLLAMAGYEDSFSPVWLSNNYHTYIRLRPGADPKVFEEKFPSLFKKYAGPQVQQILDKTIEEIEETGQGVYYSLQALHDIHLTSNLTAELEPNGDIKYVYIFVSIAFFILLIACINFMNLATARSANRAKEVGVRKTLGALKTNLIGQFLTESTLMSIMAFMLALFIAQVGLSAFGALAGKTLSLPLSDPLFLGGMTLGALLIGLLTGVYPAFYLSSFIPVDTLKGKLRAGLRSGALRNGLVVFQFVISILLIIGTLAINQQLRFIRNIKLGFDREQVLLLHDAYALGQQREAFKEQLKELPEVKRASYSSYLPVRSSRSDNTMWPEGKMTETNAVSTQIWRVDHDYVPTIGLNIIEGRNFSRDMPTDSNAVILNQRAVDLYGFEDPIGKRISTFTEAPGADTGENNMVTFHIIGVVENFHYESLRENIDALGLFLAPSSGFLSIRYQSENPGSLIQKLEEKWRDMAPGQPFAYSFLDDRFEAMYEAEQRTGNVFLLFASLAIFIACLGLFALATFTTERRTKEIGVRKILGASSFDVFALLSGEFTKWVALAYLIALPLGWYFTRQWLRDFEYQSSLGFWLFALAALIALAIALITVSYQALRAAFSNPVEALRYE